MSLFTDYSQPQGGGTFGPVGTDFGFGLQPGGGAGNPAADAFFQQQMGMSPQDYKYLKGVNKFGAKAAGYFNTALKPYFDSAKTESDLLFGAAQASLGDARGVVNEGYGNARANMAEQQRVGMQQISNMQTQALGATQQQGFSSGYGGGTPQEAQNRQAASTYADLAAQFHGRTMQDWANLDIGQAGALASLNQAQGSLFAQQAGAAQGFGGLAFSGFNQTPIMAPSTSSSGLGGLLGGLGSLGLGLGALGV